MELLNVTPHSLVIEVEVEEAGALAHLRDDPESGAEVARRALNFLAAVRWLPVFWGQLSPQEAQAILADVQELGWPATLTRGGIHVAPPTL